MERVENDGRHDNRPDRREPSGPALGRERETGIVAKWIHWIGGPCTE